MGTIRQVSTSILPYLLSVPPGQPPSEGWPLICFLHGYGEAADRHPIQDALTKHGPLNPNNPPRILKQFIVVAPQMPIAGDRWLIYPDAVKSIVKTIQTEENGDRHRTYLSGFSYGGNGVFDLAAEQPNLWAALWPVDPTRVPPNDLGLPIWVSIGAAARRATSGYISTLKLQPPESEFICQKIEYIWTK